MEFNPNFKAIGDAFVKQYYQQFDQNRALLAPIYRSHSMLTFEGTQLQGTEAIIQKLQSLPFQNVAHVLTAIDCQPTVNNGVIVHVIGQLKTDNDPPHSFSQTFSLVPDGNTMYCLNDIFRLSLHHG